MREPLRGKQQSEAIRSNQVHGCRESTISRVHNLASAQSHPWRAARARARSVRTAWRRSSYLWGGEGSAVVSTCMLGERCPYSLATVVLPVPGLPTKTRLRLTCEMHRAVMSTCMAGVPGSPTKTPLRRPKANQRASEEIRGHQWQSPRAAAAPSLHQRSSVAITSSGGSSISSSEVISGNHLERRQLHLFIRGHQWQSPRAAASPSLPAPHSIPLA